VENTFGKRVTNSPCKNQDEKSIDKILDSKDKDFERVIQTDERATGLESSLGMEHSSQLATGCHSLGPTHDPNSQGATNGTIEEGGEGVTGQEGRG
jgi:hypothetical protein